MEKAQILEGQGDQKARDLYDQIIQDQPDSQAARVARARRDRAGKNWAAAYRAYEVALKEAPQDIELLNELEYVRQQMRPEMASRGFPYSRGERRPEEASRPWQFSRFGREPGGLGLSNYLPAFMSDVLPVVQPESPLLSPTATSSTAGWCASPAASGSPRCCRPAWAWNTGNTTRTTGGEAGPAQSGTESGLRPADQRRQPPAPARRLPGPGTPVGGRPPAPQRRSHLAALLEAGGSCRLQQGTVRHRNAFTDSTDLCMPETIRGQLQFYHKRRPQPPLGSLEVGFNLGAQTDATLRYSRRDIFDQEPYVYPRLYQSVLNLTEARITTYQQADLSYTHQFQPGLDWRGTVAGAFYSDQNRRLTLYQGLAWQALREPRMHLELTPHYYLAAYRQQHQAYFSPHAYNAFGLGLDFDRQIYRLPTLILQGTVQGVNQHGDFGPALQGLAALEWEFVANFYTDVHFFYFREFVDNYRLMTAGVSFRWKF